MSEPTPPHGRATALGTLLVTALAALLLLLTKGGQAVTSAFQQLLNDGGTGAQVAVVTVMASVVVTLGWLVVGRDRPRPLLFLAPVVAFVMWVAGAHRLQLTVQKATPDAGLATRLGDSFLGLAEGAAVWVVGAALVTFVLLALSLRFALDARTGDRVPSTRRMAGLVVGLVIIALMLVLAFSRKDIGPLEPYTRPRLALPAVPGLFGVVGMFLGTRTSVSDPAVIERLHRSTLLSCAAVVVASIGAALADLMGFSGETVAPEMLVRVMVELSTETTWIFLYGLAFVVPPLAVLALTTRPRPEGLALVAWPALLAVGIVALMFGRARSVLEDTSMVVRGIAAAPLESGDLGACGSLPQSRVVHLNAALAVSTDVDARFGTDGSCADVAAAIHRQSGGDDVWLAVDPETPHGRVACIFDELARTRGPTASEPQRTSRSRVAAARGCGVVLVGQDGASPSCRRFVLPHPRCAVDPGDSTPTPHFDLILSAHATMRMFQGSTLVMSKALSAGDVVPDVVLHEWKMNGQHRDPYDSRVDRLVVRADPTLPFRKVDAQLAPLVRLARPGRGGETNVPVFEVGLASLRYSYRASSGEAPPLPPLGTHLPLADQRANLDTARAICARSECSRTARAQVLAAEFRQRWTEAHSWIYLAKAHVLDPNVPIESPEVQDGGAAVVKDDAGTFLRLDQQMIAPRVPERVSVSVVAPEGIPASALEPLLSEIQTELHLCAIDAYRSDSKPAKLHVTVTTDPEGHPLDVDWRGRAAACVGVAVSTARSRTTLLDRRFELEIELVPPQL